MDSDMKWFMILMGMIIVLPLLGLGVEKYQINQCRIEAIKNNLEPDKIAQVCK